MSIIDVVHSGPKLFFNNASLGLGTLSHNEIKIGPHSGVTRVAVAVKISSTFLSEMWS